MRTPSSLAFFGLLVLAGCSSNPIPIGPEQDFTFQLHETGGFFGVNQTVAVDSAKDTITFRASPKSMVESDRITPAELESVRSAINASDFGGGPYPCSGCSDQSHFVATLDSDSGSAEVDFDGGDGAPAPLNTLAEVVHTVRDNHFDITSSP